MAKILQIDVSNGISYKVGITTDEVMFVGIQYKRDGNPFYRGKDGCYEVHVVRQADLAKKEEKQEKKLPPALILYTVPGKSVVLVTHDIAEDNKPARESNPIVLERVQA